MQLLISITTKAEGKAEINKLFPVYETDQKKAIHFLKFKNQIKNKANMVNRGMGMCYYDQYWYAGLFCVEHRVGSRLLITDLNNGNQTINNLSLTKAIHSIIPLCKCGIYNMILACSTQNDCISVITTHGTRVVTEDIYFDYLNSDRRLKLNWSKEYIWDDLLHANCVYVNNGTIYSAMFYDYQIKEDKRRNDWRTHKEEMKGAVYDLTNQKLLRHTSQPHSLIVNQFGERIFCESGTFKLINIDKNQEAQCAGFTRGLLEDKQRGGYWVGLSYHRVFSYKLKGAALQFVSYDMKIEETIDLSSVGKEIYDIIPFKNNKNWGG